MTTKLVTDSACSVYWCESPVHEDRRCLHHHLKKVGQLSNTFCAKPGCARTTSLDHCVVHRQEVAKLLNPPRQPRARRGYSRERPPLGAGELECLVNGCGRAQEEGATLCQPHGSVAKRFRLTQEEFADIRNVGRCFACGAKGEVAIDHWHGHHPGRKNLMCRECIRGPLCRSCNTALGLLEDDPRRLESLIMYLSLARPGHYFGKPQPEQKKN